jgi:hypothetical protein
MRYGSMHEDVALCLLATDLQENSGKKAANKCYIACLQQICKKTAERTAASKRYRGKNSFVAC